MYVDAVTTAALVDEFMERILGGRVQFVVEVNTETIGMEIYANRQRHYLIMTAENQNPRCLLVYEKVRRGVNKPSPIGLLLKKFIDGARVTGVSMPPWERILHVDFSGPEGDVTLIAEMIDRRANVIMVVEDEILDSIRRVGPQKNSRRLILPKHSYVPPPSQDKYMPENVTEGMLATWLNTAEDGQQAWRVLVTHIAGVSPLFAREVVYRAAEDARCPAFDVASSLLYETFTAMLQQMHQHEWEHCIVPSKRGGYRAFAAYWLHHLPNAQPADSMSSAMETYFGAPTGEDAYEAAKSEVRKQVENALDRAARKYAALSRQSASREKIEEYRKKGELIYAYAATLSQGTEELEAQYDVDGPVLHIDLDSELTPAENAQKYFDKYEKAKRAAEEIPKMQAYAKVEVLYLEQLKTDLEMAENWPEIEAVRETLQKNGYWKGAHTKGPRGGKPGIRRFTTENGFVIFIGRNSSQNHKLVTQRSDPDDLWLHARNIPGSHVIIKHDGRPIPDNVIEQAAQMAAFYSSAREDTTVDVDVTERRYVRPIKGAPPGLVTYKNEYTVTVQPRKAL
jgi:predicted ribosome quality control (RQC) complex YloA/Tae2 family protein